MYTYSVAAGAEDHCSMLHNVEKCSTGETFPQCTERFVFDLHVFTWSVSSSCTIVSHPLCILCAFRINTLMVICSNSLYKLSLVIVQY